MKCADESEIAPSALAEEGSQSDEVGDQPAISGGNAKLEHN
jgi:hypothetical protein